MRAVLSTTFRSLQVRNYRLFATGQLIKLIGVWMMFTAQDWLVLDLSGNSPGALGIVTALQFLPVLLLTLWAGKLADRYDKRKLLIVANAAFAITAIVFADPGRQRRGGALARLPVRRACSASRTPSRPRYASRSSPNWSERRCCRTRWRSPRPPSTPPGSAARRWPAWRSPLFDTGPVFLIATVLAIAPVFSYPRCAPADLLPRREAGRVDGRDQDRRRPQVRLEAPRPAPADRR